jgi:hypothetical protein
MHKFLDAYNQPEFNQEEINHLNRPVASLESEAVIKSLPTKNSPGPNGFIPMFYQTF